MHPWDGWASQHLDNLTQRPNTSYHSNFLRRKEENKSEFTLRMWLVATATLGLTTAPKVASNQDNTTQPQYTEQMASNINFI